MPDITLTIVESAPVNLTIGGGASAYQIWIDAGNTGTEADFLASLVGADGADGPQGPAGATGATGATGPQGPQGDPGFISLNGLTDPTQTFAAGTSGTDFGIDSSGSTHTFNLPSSSASNRGLLLAMDWTTFNSKVGGSGTINYLSKWAGSAVLGDSLIYDDGAFVGVGTITPTSTFDVRAGSTGFRAMHSAPSGGAAVGGIKIFDYTPNDGGQSTVSITGTNSTHWTSGSQGIVFKNNFRAIEIGSNTTFLSAFGGDQAWLGTSAIQSVDDALIVTAGSGYANLVAMRYAGTPYPELRTSAKRMSFYTKAAAGWPDGASYTSYGSIAVFIDGNQNTGLRTNTPASTLDVNGANGYSQLRLRATYTPTSTADALGNTGDTAWDDNYFYIKTAAGWKRSALSTF